MTEDLAPLLTIAVLGGTGKEGSGLARRWAMSGYKVIIGSRDAERAAGHAAELNTGLGGDYLKGLANEEAAVQADIVVLSVPYAAHQTTLAGVKDRLPGKILLDITIPLQPPQIRVVHLPEGKAAALEAQALLGEDVKVVSAFHHLSHVQLNDLEHPIDCDVLICGNDADAKAAVIKLVEAIGTRGIDAGSLQNSIAVEAFTSVLLYINKAHGIKHSGIRITGIA
jgi:8-hydroxy-5-deazaflavin:NADPH oxidoreductase